MTAPPCRRPVGQGTRLSKHLPCLFEFRQLRRVLWFDDCKSGRARFGRSNLFESPLAGKGVCFIDVDGTHAARPVVDTAARFRDFATGVSARTGGALSFL